MKPCIVNMTVAVIALLTAMDASATNRTTWLGQVDAAADSSFISLLDSPRRQAVETTVFQPEAFRTVTRLRDNTSSVAAITAAETGNAERYLMLLLGSGLVAFHLRRKQKSLRHRPLSGVAYR